MVTRRQLARAERTTDRFLTAQIRVVRTDPAAVTFTDGKIVDGPATVVWEGPASISDAKDPVTRTVGTETVQQAAWLIRARLDANAVQPGDRIDVTDPGDYPLPHRALWVHAVKGRHVAVLARITATATRPGDDG